jgi:putative transposase
MLANLAHEVSDTTIKNMLKQQGIEPAPTRSKQTTWTDFISSHAQTMADSDFFTTEVWTKGGFVTFYVLFIIKLATRRVEIAGNTAPPDSAWIKQVARNLTDCEDGFLNETTYP